MAEESGELPVNKDPALLRQMLKKVSGKNHKLKEELAVLQETIQNHQNALILKEEAISRTNEKLQELEAAAKEKDKEIEDKNNQIEQLIKQKNAEIIELKQQFEQTLQTNKSYTREFELDARMKAFEQDKLKFEIEKKTFQLEIQKLKEQNPEQPATESENLTEKEQKLNEQFELLASEQHKLEIQKKVLDEMKQNQMDEITRIENLKTDFEIEKATVQAKLEEIRKLTAKNESILKETKEEREKIIKKQKEVEEETNKLTSFRDTMSEKIKEFEEREKNLLTLEEDKRKAEEQLKTCLEREKSANESKIKYESQQSELDRLQATLSAKLKLCDATNEEAQKKMDQLLLREEQLDAKVSRMRENADKSRKDAEQTIQNLMAQIDEASRKARIEADKANDLQTQLNQVLISSNELKKENEDLKTSLERLHEASAAANELEELRKQIIEYKEKEKELIQIKEELKQAKDENSIQGAKYQTLEKKLQAEIQRYDESTRGHIDGVHASYLKKTLLQFFVIEDNKKREEMITMLLTLVNCDESQILRAVKCWKESQQIINSGIWPFK